MPASFYDPNDNERKRLLRATATDPDGNRRFTDTVGRSGFERIDGDLRVRNYDGGGIRFEQRGPNEWRSFDSTTPVTALQNPDRTGQIAPDRTFGDRIARAISNEAGNGTIGRDSAWMTDRFAATQGFTAADKPRGFQGNIHDFDHERRYGTNATINSAARGFGAPMLGATYGNASERERISREIEDARIAHLTREAGLSPLGIAGSAAGGSEGRARAKAELDAIRLRRAQEADRDNQYLLADRDAESRENIAHTTAVGQIGVARENRLGQVGAAKAQADSAKHGADAQKEVGLENARRPVPLATQGGVSVRNPETGAWETTIPEPRPAAAGQPIRIGSQMVDRDGNVVYDADPQGFKAAADAAQAEYEAILKNPTASDEEKERARQKAEAARKTWNDSRQGGAQAGENDWM